MVHTFSIEVLVCLLLILAASLWVFFELTRQWTADRSRASMLDWAREQRFKMSLPPHAILPASLQSLSSEDPQVELSLVRGPVVILKLTTAARPVTRRNEWHVIVRQLDLAWKPTALRPVAAESSLLDLFALDGFPSLLPPERFVVFASEPRAARAMAACPARGLLPADIGLLIHGPYVSLDFSARPFDPIEFNRMIVILEQLMGSLPVTDQNVNA